MRNSYTPGSRLEKLYRPSGPVDVERVSCVPTFVIVSSAAGMTAAFGSVTTPVKLAEKVWASTGVAPAIMSTANSSGSVSNNLDFIAVGTSLSLLERG